MAASNEWFEYHLTPTGWVHGSKKTDFANASIVQPPSDRVLTVRESEHFGSSFSTPARTFDVTFSTSDESLLAELTGRFGASPDI